MFILGLRDAYGVKIAIWLILIWNVYFFVALYAGIVWFSLLLLGLSISASFYASSLLCKHRKDLRFGNKIAEEYAFPSSARNVQAAFNMHLAAFLVFFLGPLLATTAVGIRPLKVDELPLLYAGYLFGLPGVLGIIHHFVRKAVDRGVKQSTSE